MFQLFCQTVGSYVSFPPHPFPTSTPFSMAWGSWIVRNGKGRLTEGLETSRPTQPDELAVLGQSADSYWMLKFGPGCNPEFGCYSSLVCFDTVSCPEFCLPSNHQRTLSTYGKKKQSWCRRRPSLEHISLALDKNLLFWSLARASFFFLWKYLFRPYSLACRKGWLIL